MKQNIVSSQSLDSLPSPGTGNYHDKGWSSERVPHPSGGRSRRQIGALRPFYSGRALPSKWEDAERWICSPVLGYGVATNNNYQSLPHRRPKSKSGPIPPGITYYSNCSPSIHVLDGMSIQNLVTNSPFSTGVLMPNGVAVHYGGGDSGRQDNVPTPLPAPGWTDLISESSLPSFQDEKPEDSDEAENMVNRVISRRDMATQMSTESSAHSSARGISSSPPYIPDMPPEVESHGENSAKLEVREVQVDKRSTMIRWSKRHGSCTVKNGSPGVKDCNQNGTHACTSSWDISDSALDFSKLQREEARITAWENLQKAQAEAAIRKLEMKLEKKRSSTMDKILNKLKTAEMRANEMRSSMSAPGDHQTPKTPLKITFFRKHGQFRCFSSCFTSDAF